ncbi:MAG: hypothetical protein C0501_01530 [Isosphaera sp.]|nr:hypothetical protein [Isosphaera sp.]
MQAMTFAGLAAGLFCAAGQAPKDVPAAAKDTPAAEYTRTKLLKARVTVGYTDTPVGEILKEFAHQAEMQAEQPLMWAYGPGFAFGKKVTFAAKGVPLEAALDQLLTLAGGGYVVVSKDGDKYDGWVRLTTGSERGSEPPPADAAEEAEAAGKLGLAKKLLDAGKPESARPVLEIVARKYPATKAGAEAKELLGKLEK